MIAGDHLRYTTCSRHGAQVETVVWGGGIMGKDVTICVGTIGSGIWRSPDGGETWTRVRPSRYPENDVRALAVHPRDPHIVYAGTDSGVYRSEDRGRAGNAWMHR